MKKRFLLSAAERKIENYEGEKKKKKKTAACRQACLLRFSRREALNGRRSAEVKRARFLARGTRRGEKKGGEGGKGVKNVRLTDSFSASRHSR